MRATAARLRVGIRFALVAAIAIVAWMLWPSSSNASPSSVSDFSVTYPTSSSDVSGCQLCHGDTNNTWNPFGFSLLGGGFPPDFVSVEDQDADGDGNTNLTEINAGSQPGWTDNGNVCFDRAGTSSACTPPDGIPLDPSSTPPTAAATAVPDNTPPVALDDSYSMNQGVVLDVAFPGILGNDEDNEGDTLTATMVLGTGNGSLSLRGDGSFIYTPDPAFSGIDNFLYLANDGQSDSNQATVTITVNPTTPPTTTTTTVPPTTTTTVPPTTTTTVPPTTTTTAPPTTTTTIPPGDPDGRKLYVASCSACHGVDGRARSNIRGEKPDKVVKKVLRGVGRVMPSFANTLSMAEIDRIADYVSGLDKYGSGRNGN